MSVAFLIKLISLLESIPLDFLHVENAQEKFELDMNSDYLEP